MKIYGIWTLIALVVGNMVGSGIFLLPSSLASYGSISLLAWIFTGFGAVLIAIVFSRLSLLVPHAGGPYVYCEKAFGKFFGFMAAYIYWIYSWVGNAAIATSLVSYMSYFFPVINNTPLISFLLIVSVIWILTFLNILSIAKVGALQIATVLIKIVPLILICVFGFGYIHLENYSIFNATGNSTISALAGSAGLTMWALTGIESATIPRRYIKNPEKHIPRATMFGTLIAITLYVVSTIIVMGIIPMHDLANSAAPFADAARSCIGVIGGGIVSLAAIFSSVGALNGWILLQGQVPQSAADNKIFPEYFAKVSKYNTPTRSLIISSLFITLLLAMNFEKSLVSKFTSIISLATISILIVYLMTMVAEIKILVSKKEVNKIFLKSIVNFLAVIYIVWAFVGLDVQMMVYCLFLILSGIPVYFMFVNKITLPVYGYGRSKIFVANK